MQFIHYQISHLSTPKIGSKCCFFIPVYWGSIVIAILSFVIAIGHFTLMVYCYSSLEKLTTLENVSVFGVLP